MSAQAEPATFAFTPEYRATFAEAIKVWTASDPRPTLEYVLNLESPEPSVRAFAAQQVDRRPDLAGALRLDAPPRLPRQGLDVDGDLVQLRAADHRLDLLKLVDIGVHLAAQKRHLEASLLV
mgnify:CR=1 FL=1